MFGREHLDTLVEFQLKLAKETEGISLEPDTVREGVSRVLENPNLGEYYVALNSNNDIQGMLLTIREWSDWRCASVLWIHSVYIPVKHRKKGIFKNLYEHIKARVKTNADFAGIRLYVDKTNQDAIQVYKALDMSDEHYSLFEWLKD